MTKRGQQQKKQNRVDCKKILNELVWFKNYSSNSRKIRQQSINPKFNRLNNNGDLLIEYIEKDDAINVHDFWHPACLYPFERWTVNYIRHQCTNYDILRNKYKKCYSIIRRHCFNMIEKRYSCFKNECNNQKKRKKHNIDYIKYSNKMPRNMKTAIICRILVFNTCCKMDDIIKKVENIYDQKIYPKDIWNSVENGWIFYNKNKDCFKLTKKYPL